MCRLSKDNHKTPFGGMQVTTVGDFLQLNPEPNDLYGDQGQPCFQHPHWDQTFSHKVVLDVVMRQEETNLVQVIADMAKRVPLANDTEKLMFNLSQPLEVAESLVTKLFATNLEAQRHNFEILQSLMGETFQYMAVDEGNTRKLTESIWLQKNLN